MAIKSWFQRCETVCLLGLLAASLAAGCGGTSQTKYIPAADNARSALTAALTAWQSGQEKPGKIESKSPAIEVVDSLWGKGKKLKEFEVMNEIPADDGPKRFAVRLSLADNSSPIEMTYFVVGKDPLWVIREADYQPPNAM